MKSRLDLAGKLAFAITLLCFASLANAQSPDVIRLASESGTAPSIRGTIKRMNRLNITIEANGNDRRVDVNEIRLVTFGNEPRELRSARANLLEGRENRALEELTRISVEEVASEFVKGEIEFQKARVTAKLALRGEDKTLAEAETTLSALLSNPVFEENFHYYEALELQGDVWLALGKFDEAEKNFSELSRLPWPKMALKATRLVAGTQLRQEKWAEALKNFESIESSDLNNAAAQEQKNLAKIGRASALAGLGRPDEGIELLEQMIQQESSENKALFAQLYNALGACYLKSNKPKYAKHQFLHVHLLYNQDADAHAEALFNLIGLWTQENNIRNSDACKELLRSRYPNSPWTAKL